MSLVEIKDFNALIDNKPFFDQHIINKQEAYENMQYTALNLLDSSYHHYELIGIDISRQSYTTIPQQINCTRK